MDAQHELACRRPLASKCPQLTRARVSHERLRAKQATLGTFEALRRVLPKDLCRSDQTSRAICAQWPCLAACTKCACIPKRHVACHRFSACGGSSYFQFSLQPLGDAPTAATVHRFAVEQALRRNCCNAPVFVRPADTVRCDLSCATALHRILQRASRGQIASTRCRRRKSSWPIGELGQG